jgi:hypothetical protein
MTRIGIELTPVSCRIVEVEVHRRPLPASADVCVRSFHCLDKGPATRAKLTMLRGHDLALVVWGLSSHHGQAFVKRGSFVRMRREAVAAARKAGIDTRRMLADMAVSSSSPLPAKDCPVTLALVDARQLRSVLQPLLDVGLRVRSIVTPPLALFSLARRRAAPAAPVQAEVYVSLEETATALALLQNGGLVGGYELRWGYRDERSEIRSRAEISYRLADEIDGLLARLEMDRSAVSQVCVCGGLPELRSMTMPLMERLDIEVETLDSLFGIDASNLPDPSDEFRERSAELRLAWAVAADWPAPLNLLRERQRRQLKIMLTRGAVAAGVVAGVSAASWLTQTSWWESTSPARIPTASPLPRAVEPTTPRLRTVLAERATAQTPEQPPSVTRGASPPAAVQPVAPPVLPPVAARIEQAPAVRLGPSTPASEASPRVETSAPPRLQVTSSDAPVRQVAAPPAVTEPPRPPGTELPPLSFEATLGTILYAPERKVAIIDGRVVQVGDDVRGARIVEITQRTVLLRDAQGRLRQLSLGATAR